MNGSAHVTSLQALREFRVALKRYELSIRSALESLGVEVQRASDWVSHDRPRYWLWQGRRAEERVAAARTELELCKLASLKNEKRDCLQEKKNLERATARLRHCEERLKASRQWQHQMDHHAEESQGKIARLTHYLDHDIPLALAALDRKITALEKYAEPAAVPRTAADQRPSPPEHP